MRKNRKNNSRTWGNRICIAAFLLTCSLMLGGCGVKKEKEADSELPKIVIGMDYFEPYSYQASDGEYKGIDVELAEEAFQRLGYQPEFEKIIWEDKEKLLSDGAIDCLWSCYSMNEREDKYQWAGPYMVSRQAIAVNKNSSIQDSMDLEGKKIAVQTTGKPEEILLNHLDMRFPENIAVISLEDRSVQYASLDCGYVDAIAAHETAILQYVKDYDADFRILDDAILTTGIGVAFAKEDNRGLAEQIQKTFSDMQADGTMKKIVGAYLEHPQTYLEVDRLGE